jgi:hypothetical protein
MKALYLFQLKNGSNSASRHCCKKYTRHSKNYDTPGLSLHVAGGTSVKQAKEKDNESRKRSGQRRPYSLINPILSKVGFVKCLKIPTLKTLFNV